MKEKDLKDFLREQYPIEDESCEWKEFKNLKHSVSGAKGDDIISYISALANMNGGHLVIGVKDKTLDIVGVQDFHDYNPTNIKLRILGKCPNLNSEDFRVEALTAEDTGKTVWIFHVARHHPRLPVYAHDKAWQRIDDSLVELRRERLDAILAESIDITDWSSQIISGATLSDLDPSAIAIAREKVKEKNQNASFVDEIDGWSDRTFLDKAKLTIQGKITRTTILLLGRPESEHFISPSVAKISWVLKDEGNIERDYEHFSPPFLLNIDKVLKKIRNLKYRYLPDGTLFPIEINQYDNWVIREALNNCIAHQDYELRGRISVVEWPDELIFANLGSFIPGSVEKVIERDSPPEKYRNPFLANAMVNLKMIDSIGSGIKRMFNEQRKRFFPLPDYDLSDQGKVVVTLQGKVLDKNYTRLLIENMDLDLITVMFLDKVQKQIRISKGEHQFLKSKNLVEGRYPNLYVSHEIASVTGEKAKYIKNRGFDKKYYQDLIIEFIKKNTSVSREEIDELIIEKLPAILKDVQKKRKINNLLTEMRMSGIIENIGPKKRPKWLLTKAYKGK